MHAIGGYFELADYEEGKGFPHQDGVLLNTGRNALEYILEYIPNVKNVYMPIYTCEAILQPLKRNYITFTFYHINNKFEIDEDIHLGEGEYLIVNNYFGLKDKYINHLIKKYGERLIVDNSQAFFANMPKDVKAFYSPRKFVGVADGGVAVGVDDKYSLLYDEDDSTLHDTHLLIRKQKGAEAGFKFFQQNEMALDNQPIRRMCRITRDILFHIDYDDVITRRRTNFKYLHSALCSTNHIQIPPFGDFACPMVYPYWGELGKDIRNLLLKNKVFTARYWPNVLNWGHNHDLEYLFAEEIIPLPIDQRYGNIEMKRIIDLIIK